LSPHVKSVAYDVRRRYVVGDLTVKQLADTFGLDLTTAGGILGTYSGMAERYVMFRDDGLQEQIGAVAHAHKVARQKRPRIQLDESDMAALTRVVRQARNAACSSSADLDRLEARLNEGEA